MARVLFFVQGEGRGHLTQALVTSRRLEGMGHEVVEVLTGCREEAELPDYYLEAFGKKHSSYPAPWLVPGPNRKGILLGRSLLINACRIPLYLAALLKLRKRVRALRPDIVFNFYEGIAALALRRCPDDIHRISVGHHFYHSINDIRPEGRFPRGRHLLSMLSAIIAKSSDRVLALSFGPGKASEGKIRVHPPMIGEEIREAVHRKGERELAYFMYEGHVWDMVLRRKGSGGAEVDVFCRDEMKGSLPEGFSLHALSGPGFREKLKICSRLWCTAGFETVAEAAWLGVPVTVIPSERHYEQYLNARDARERGIAEVIDPGRSYYPPQIRTFDRDAYRAWVERGAELLKEVLEA